MRLKSFENTNENWDLLAESHNFPGETHVRFYDVASIKDLIILLDYVFLLLVGIFGFQLKIHVTLLVFGFELGNGRNEKHHKILQNTNSLFSSRMCTNDWRCLFKYGLHDFNPELI